MEFREHLIPPSPLPQPRKTGIGKALEDGDRKEQNIGVHDPNLVNVGEEHRGAPTVEIVQSPLSC